MPPKIFSKLRREREEPEKPRDKMTKFANDILDLDRQLFEDRIGGYQAARQWALDNPRKAQEFEDAHNRMKPIRCEVLNADFTYWFEYLPAMIKKMDQTVKEEISERRKIYMQCAETSQRIRVERIYDEAKNEICKTIQ